ncbi:YggT family protein [Fusibacter sp. JL298sf-3]
MMIQLVIAIVRFLDLVATLIVIRALLSWFIRDPRNQIMSIMLFLTEPILSPIRSLLMKLNIGGHMLDFSPLVAILLVQILRVLIPTLLL